MLDIAYLLILLIMISYRVFKELTTKEVGADAEVEKGYLMSVLMKSLKYSSYALLLYFTYQVISSVNIFSLDVTWMKLCGLLLGSIGSGLQIWVLYILGQNFSTRLSMFEKHELITTGPYASIRHPMYTSIIVLTLSLYFMANNVLYLILPLLWTGVLIWRVIEEEKMLLDYFKDEYKHYIKHTKRLLPFIY